MTLFPKLIAIFFCDSLSFSHTPKHTHNCPVRLFVPCARVAGVKEIENERGTFWFDVYMLLNYIFFPTVGMIGWMRILHTKKKIAVPERWISNYWRVWVCVCWGSFRATNRMKSRRISAILLISVYFCTRVQPNWHWLRRLQMKSIRKYLIGFR